MSTGATRRYARSLAAMLFLATTARLFAQPVVQTRTGVDVFESYDSNLLFAPHGRIGDFQTRISPSLESQRQWPLADVIARYALDADRFANYPSLSGVTTSPATSPLVDLSAMVAVIFAVDDLFPGFGCVSRWNRAAVIRSERGVSRHAVTS